MAGNRVVKVSVVAEVNSYLAGMDRVSKAAREGRTDAEALTAKLEAQRKAFTAVGAGMLAAGGVVAAGLILATKRAADFDQAMSNVAATGQDARDSIAGLREAAIQAGAETAYSATQSAAAIEELAKAGINADNILSGGLTGALDLAAAGGIEVAQAAEIASNSLNQFKLKGSDATHVADVLAAGAGKASGGVDDLGMALSQTGQVAAATGLSIEETTAGLAAFASAGLKGSDAGTSFKTMLGALTPNSEKAASEMERLGINAFDAQGKFIGLEAFAGNLRNSLKGLTDEQRQASLEIMFGSDAVRAGIELYNQGADGIRKWISAVDDQGYAARTASTRLDNLSGDVEKLSGAFDSALIGIGESGQGPLRMVVQGVTEIVDTFNDLPEPGQQAVFWIGAAASAALLAGGTFFVAVPKIAAFNAGLADMGTGAQRAGRLLGGLAKSAGLAGGVAAAMIIATSAMVEFAREVRHTDDAVAAAWTTNDSFVHSMEQLGVVSEGSAEATKRALDALASGNVLGTVGIDIQSLRDGLTDLQSGLDGLPIETAVSRFQDWADELELTEIQQKTLLDEMPQLRDKIREHLVATGEAADRQAVFEFATRKSTDAVETSTEAFQAQAEEVNGVRDALLDLFDEINALNDANQRAIQSNADWLQGLNDLAAQVTETGTSLDEATAAGANNAAMLSDLAADAITAAQAQFEVDQATGLGSKATEKYVATLAEQRRKFEESAVAAGFNADEVKVLADRIFALPNERSTALLLDTSQALSAADELVRQISQKRPVMLIDARPGTVVRSGQVGVGFHGGIAEFYAQGGFHNLVPMNKIAQFVSPNTWRVVGDRPDVPEAFIPLDGSLRSRKILAETNIRMPGGPMLMASGGFVQPQYAPPVWTTKAAAAPVINVTVQAAAGMDEEALARKAARYVARRLT